MDCLICGKKLENEYIYDDKTGFIHKDCLVVKENRKDSTSMIVEKTIAKMLKLKGFKVDQYGLNDYKMAKHFNNDHSWKSIIDFPNKPIPKIDCDWDYITDIKLDDYFYQFASTMEPDIETHCVSGLATCKCGKITNCRIILKASISTIINAAIEEGYVDLD